MKSANTKNTQLRYIAYMRKSTEGDERQALSLGKQEDAIKESFPDLNIIDWVKESRSAFEAENRPAFDNVLERIKNGEADGIVAWKSNRLSRNAFDAGKVVHYINIGIIKDLKFARENFENTPDGIKNLQYALADSRYYSASLAIDVREGNDRKRKLGWLPQASFSGYQDELNPLRGRDGQPEKITAIDPERFPLLQKAWRLFLTGEYSVPAVLEILNTQYGYRTKKTPNGGGKPLSRQALYKIFTNVRYAGKIPDPITGELLNGSYQPMVSVDEFNLTQQLLGRRGKPRISEKKNFIYKGIAICGECGCSVTAEEHIKKNGRKYVYYHCTHKKKNYKCKQQSIEEKELTRQLEGIFDGLTIRKEFEEWGLETIREMNDEESTDREALLASQAKTIAENEAKANKLLDCLLNGIITEEEYTSKSETIKAELKRLKIEQGQTLENGNDWRETMRRTLNVLFNGRDKFKNGDVFAKREVLQSLGSNTILKDGKISINTYKWLEPIKNEYKNLESQLEEGSNSDLQIKNASNEAIRQRWRRVGDSNSRCRSPRTNDLANRPLQPLG